MPNPFPMDLVPRDSLGATFKRKNMYKIIKSYWFTNATTGSKCIGIVIVKEMIGEKEKAFIGIANGNNKFKDERRIAYYGSSFPIEIARML
jgi:hypothetical protein